MADQFELTPTSSRSATVSDVILDPPGNGPPPKTRKIVRAMIVDNAHHDAEANVNITIMHQRQKPGTYEWEDADSFNLATLKAGEEVRLRLGAYETRQLYETLDRLYRVGAAGVPTTRKELAVVDKETAALVEHLDTDSWKAILTLRPDLALAVALKQQYETRRQAVEEFGHHFWCGDWTEPDWQRFFERNTWILGQGLAYQFLHVIEAQAAVGGTTLTGSGGQVVDYLLATSAAVRFTVLVDIKTPETPLVSSRPYRNKVYKLGDDLVGGVSQLQSYRRTWAIEGSRQDENRRQLEGSNTFTYEPKAILVIGRTDSLEDDQNRRATLELFRRSLHAPEVVTFDELLERAEYWVKVSSEAE
jgi:hypothetical protein